MSTVVQATCPGCKQVLRIPSDWLNQPFRCKHCRTIIQARAQAPIARPASPSTPLPPTRAIKPVPIAKKAPQAVPVASPPPAPAYPAMPAVPMATPVASPPAAPMAIPVNAAGLPLPPIAFPVAATPTFSAFDGIDAALDAPTGTRPRPRRRRSWIPLIVCVLLLGGAAGAAVVFWPQLAPLFEKGNKKGAEVTQDDGKKSTPPDENKDKTTPARDKDKTTPSKDKDKTTPAKDKDKTTPAKDKDKTTPAKDKDKTTPAKDKPADKPTLPKDKPADKDKPTDKKPEDPTKKPPIPLSTAFPRRALVISLHNYLFANPLTAGDPTPSGRNIQNLIGRFSQTKGFRISPNQVAFLSDAARPPRFQSFSPIKATIEATITEYLQTARAQDRVLLVFAGHGAEIDGKVYLAPIEGDLTQTSNMIPLEWVYKQMTDCKAQQKVLILDVCRTNMARGEERASFGAMTPKFDLVLKNPPEGVQVWASCTEGQQSYEFEDFRINNSVFLDSLYQVADKGIDGVIQKLDDPIPLEKFVEQVNALMKKELEPLKLTQTSRLSGTLGPQLPFDPNDKLAVEPTVIAAAKKTSADSAIVRGILKELNVPPIKKQQSDGLLRYEAMPPFNAEVLDKYPIDNTPNPLREAIERAQALLWAISPNEPPPELAGAVRKIKDSGELKTNLSNLKESYRAPAGAGNAENQFKTLVNDDQRGIASIIRLLDEEITKLTAAGEMKKDAPKRWQLNYDFMLARLQQQYAYIIEYQSMLGAMRREFPPRDATIHSGWRLASKKKLQGDAEGRKKLKDAEKLLDKLIADHAGTPWELLARREKMTALGLEWKAN